MITNRTFMKTVFILLAALFLSGCAQSTPTPSPTSLPSTPTLEPTQTATALPADTPVPSPISLPPTATTEPTVTETTIPITVPDILDLWFASEHAIPHYIQIGDDGMVRAYDSLTDIENETHFALDKYTLEGDIITFDGIGGVCRGITGQYQISMPEPGILHFKLISDTCTNRINGVNGTVYTAVPNETATTNLIAVEDILGLWFASEHAMPHYNQIGDDGMLRAYASLTDIENETPFALDQYTLDGDIITLDGIGSVCRRITGQYQVSMPEPGKLQFKLISDTCTNRINGLNGTVYTFVDE